MLAAYRRPEALIPCAVHGWEGRRSYLDHGRVRYCTFSPGRNYGKYIKLRAKLEAPVFAFPSQCGGATVIGCASRVHCITFLFDGTCMDRQTPWCQKNNNKTSK